ncbi:MAG: hypothetical protein AAF940_04685 [Pseudomonadota bacterium]
MAKKPDNVVSSALVDAVRKVRIASAERSDVVVDMKEADQARLEILAQLLQPVFDDVPLSDDRFDFAISSGLQPRLWIDATAHVAMGRDRRTYRFVRDTRMGRITLGESNDPAPIADAVTTYIAERLHERELAFAGDDLISLRNHVMENPTRGDFKRQAPHNISPPPAAPLPAPAAAPFAAQPQEARTAPPRQMPAHSAGNSKPVKATETSQAVLWALGLFIIIGTLILIFGAPQ